ncbi:hypothetical protein [Streptomyces sp. NRRL F-5123]|uniref:hypothetical protein n=1 Tax=Streptomyces sp. NRRL F-5123 TaxID=1463856 RepID=UPI0004E27316|nr:hypothetical protein [Streptomyces sp. NRRL F-5123]
MHITEAIAASIVALSGVVVAVAAGVWTWRQARPATAPQQPARRPAADAYLPCHTPVCGHMTTPHDRTPAGLTCRSCGTTTEVEQ